MLYLAATWRATLCPTPSTSSQGRRSPSSRQSTPPRRLQRTLPTFVTSSMRVSRVSHGISTMVLLLGSRVFIPVHNDLRHQALLLAHSAGHEGVHKTLHRLRTDFFIPGNRTLVQDFVRTCTQKNKTQALLPAVLLQPLPCCPRCGRISQWILSKGCPRLAESRST